MPSDVLALRGMRCNRCGFVSTPVQYFGCQRCGANGDTVASVELEGLGTVLAEVTVYQHRDPEVQLPLVVGAVELDDGPVVRARLNPAITAGSRVVANNVDETLVFAAVESR